MLIPAFATLALASPPLAPQEPLCGDLPPDCLAVLELPGLSTLLEGGLDQPWVQRLRSIPSVEQALLAAPMQPEGLLALGGLMLGTPVLPALAELCSEGAVLGLALDGDQALGYFLMEGEDADELETLVERALHQLETSQGLERNSLLNAGTELSGARLWSLGDELAFAVRGARFYASRNADALGRMLTIPDRRGSLAGTEAWSAAQAQSDPQAAARLWLDLSAIAQVDGGRALDDLRAMVSDPGVHFLLGSDLARMGGANVSLVELFAEQDELRLSTRALGSTEKLPQSLLPGSTPAPALPQARPNDLLRGHLYRNLDALFANRRELFPVDVQPKFAEATANLGLFLGGADAEEELFPHLSPWFGVIAREVALDPEPDLPLPAVCLLARLSEAEALGPRLIAGFQTAIGLINVDAAQNREPSMLLQLEVHNGIPITSANYLSPPKGDGVDARYNLVPACAVVGDTFVVGTHVELVREIANQLRQGQVSELPKSIDSLEVRGPVLHRALARNVDTLVLNAVLNDGKLPVEARQEIDGLLAITGWIESFQTTLSEPAASVTQLNFRLNLVPWSDR